MRNLVPCGPVRVARALCSGFDWPNCGTFRIRGLVFWKKCEVGSEIKWIRLTVSISAHVGRLAG